MKMKRVFDVVLIVAAVALLAACVGLPYSLREGGRGTAEGTASTKPMAGSEGAVPAVAPTPKPVQASFDPADFSLSIPGWTLTPGFKVKGVLVSPKVRRTSQGIQVLVEKGHYDDDGHYAAIISDRQYKLDGLTLEFSIDRVAGDCSRVDTWINFSFLTNKAYFAVSNVSQSKGLVCLIRPYPDTDGTIFQFFDHVFVFSNLADYGLPVNPIGRTFTVKMEKGTDDEWIVHIDGKEAARGFYDFDAIFPDGLAWLAMGASTDNDEPSLFTIRRINGEKVQ
jgi:hypothetical protein